MPYQSKNKHGGIKAYTAVNNHEPSIMIFRPPIASKRFKMNAEKKNLDLLTKLLGTKFICQPSSPSKVNLNFPGTDTE